MKYTKLGYSGLNVSRICMTLEMLQKDSIPGR